MLRDDSGCVLAKFAAFVGVRDSNEAEFIVIVIALEVSLEKDWLKRGCLIVESNSKVAISWAKTNCPWKLRFYSNKLRNLLALLRNVYLTHKNREPNGIADGVAKEGSAMEGSWVRWCGMGYEQCVVGVATG